MPTFVHGKEVGVNYGVLNMTPYFNSSNVAREAETVESTAFGSDDRSYIVGLKTGTVSLEGMFDGSTGAVDAYLNTSFGSDGALPLTVMNGGTTVGRTCVVAEPNNTNYEVSSPVAEIVAISAEFQSDNQIENGVVLAGNLAVTTTSTGTAVDNAASSTNGGVAHLHVTANTRNGTSVAKVQHSADNSTWADLVTFTTISTGTATSQRSVVASATTVNRYLRALITPAGSTGSQTVTVAFARR
jgi:hypothetical protein